MRINSNCMISLQANLPFSGMAVEEQLLGEPAAEWVARHHRQSYNTSKLKT